MTRGSADRSHLSIGEVLSLLQDDFPDVTISKIRFLEAQGLLDPERTPSGYRKFYESDVETLRWILRQQKENYLPLKVIKDRLDETGPIRTAPTDAGPGAGHGDAPDAPAAPDTETPEATAETAVGGDTPRAPAGDTATVDRRNGLATAALDDTSRPVAGRRAATPPGGDDPTLQLPTVGGGPPGAGRRPARPKTSTEGATVSLTVEELAQASGLSPRAVRELEGYGLLETHMVGDASFYDADALVIARTAAGFLEHGIEARHIRGYKVAADREAALYEQIILPLLKQRNPEARRRAEQTVAELVRLGDEMRSVLLRHGLREHLPPR